MCVQTNQMIAASKRQLDHEVKAMKRLLESRIGVPLLAELHADVGQARSTRATIR